MGLRLGREDVLSILVPSCIIDGDPCGTAQGEK